MCQIAIFVVVLGLLIICITMIYLVNNTHIVKLLAYVEYTTIGAYHSF